MQGLGLVVLKASSPDGNRRAIGRNSAILLGLRLLGSLEGADAPDSSVMTSYDPKMKPAIHHDDHQLCDTARFC